MRQTTVYFATTLSLLVVSTCNAQCNRGPRGGGGTATGTFSPIVTSAVGFNSPLAAFNPISSSPYAAFLAAQYRLQLAQQRYLIAQQQGYLQAMAQRQRNLESQLSALRNANSRGTTSRDQDGSANGRRESLRQKNAEEAFARAESAEREGRVSIALRNYRRVVRILGEADALGRRASDALERIAQTSAATGRS